MADTHPCEHCGLRFAAIERRLSQLERGRALSRSDHDALAQILPAVVGVFGSRLFVVRELFESDAPALRLILRRRHARVVGRLFARAVGQDVGDYVVEDVSTEHNATLWRVRPRG